MPSTMLVLVALVLFGAVLGALLTTTMTAFERTPRYLRCAPQPVGGRHRANP